MWEAGEGKMGVVVEPVFFPGHTRFRNAGQRERERKGEREA
jgi:hypothetical protein